MAWVVRAGRHVTHDGREYPAGAEPPMTLAQGKACSAVDWIEPCAPVEMRAEVPEAPAAMTAKKRGK